ncbi:Initiation factor 2B-related [Carpediemonas membranifera]|uniref:Translation initiation factor eIF2B subunit beta n=1 Tax=Carpediemonas membranifera TaxID=201153 RepID=A0A8J6B071_9EUKA|nr:Initiation factor 2B-related [Carpediemonas membranifera]|eukprot:KAG9390167.1 Initiation factor 2B-related [Carpediemonas membranifera]
MSSEWCFDERTMKDFDEQCIKAIDKIRQRRVTDTDEIAVSTARFFKEIIYESQGDDIEALINTIRHYGHMLQQANPSEYVIKNVMFRVLFLIRDQYLAAVRGTTNDVQYFAPSLDTLIKNAGQHTDVPFNIPVINIKKSVADLIERPNSTTNADEESLVDSIQRSIEEISASAPKHIHPSEVVLVHGYSKVTIEFLLAAADEMQGESFEVIVVERAPSMDGHQTASELADCDGITVTLIPDSAVLACMAKVDIVLLEPRAILGDGTLMVPSGGQNIAIAARRYHVPVLALAGVHRLSPLHVCRDAPVRQGAADTLADASTAILEDTIVVSPEHDMILPYRYKILITDDGDHGVSYVYRLLTELYHHVDFSPV